MIKNYELKFDVWGLLLFVVIMIPNFFWFGVRAPHDVLRTQSLTETVDQVGSICQVLMIVALCIFKNRNAQNIHINLLIILMFCSCLLYFFSWIVYYCGMVNEIVILGLIAFPCLAFLFFEIDRKNGIALIPTLIFTVCHFVYGFVNFIIT